MQGANGNGCSGAIPGWSKRGPLRGPPHATSSAHLMRIDSPLVLGYVPVSSTEKYSQNGLTIVRGSVKIDGLGRPNPKRSAADPVREQQVDPHEQQDGSAQTKSTDSVIQVSRYGHAYHRWISTWISHRLFQNTTQRVTTLHATPWLCDLSVNALHNVAHCSTLQPHPYQLAILIYLGLIIRCHLPMLTLPHYATVRAGHRW